MPQYWAVLQLAEHAEALRAADVEADLLARWPRTICRFPAVRQGVLDRDNPLSSYVFIRTPASHKLEASQYAARFLRIPGSGRLHMVSDDELSQMNALPDLPACGTLVRVVTGDWADMEGVVVAQNCTQVSVLLELWSKRAVIELPPTELVVL